MKAEQGKRNGLKRKAIIAMLLMLAVLIFIVITQSKSVQNIIVEAQEQMKYTLEENSNTTTREVGITSIDLTGLVTGDDTAHTHIYEKKYDDNYHWEECWICGDIQNREAHNKEITGTAGCAQNLGYQHESCTAGCGYSITLPKVEHTLSEWRVFGDRSYHGIFCTVCGQEITRSKCYDVNGNELGCGTGISGTCVVCGSYKDGSVHASAASDYSIEENVASECLNCGKVMATYTIETQVVAENSVKYTFVTTLQDGVTINFSQIEAGSCDPINGATYSEVEYEQISSNTYKFSATVTYDENITAPGRYEVDIHCNGYAYNGVNSYTLHLGRVYVKSDNYVPTKVSVISEGNGTIDNYSQKATVTAVYEDTWNPANNTIYMRLVDADGTVLSDWGAASQNGTRYTRTFDIVAEIREPRNVYVQVKDLCDNTTVLEDGAVTVQYIDAKAPSLTNTEEDHTSQWSKNKQITFHAQDLGVGGVQIAFNNINDYQEANGKGDNYTRTYNFYGDVYDKVTAAIYLKDALGNEQVVKVDIGKLDGTAPTITKAELQNKTILLEANDRHATLGEGSGVVGYRYVTSLEDNGTQITEDSGTYTEENQIDTSNMSKVKYVYVAPVDAVGNIGKTVKVKLATYTYTVNYYEEGTNTKLANSKVIGDKAIGEEIEETAIAIEGYNAVAPTTQTIEIKESGNEINFYYAKRTDLSYTVKYLEQGTNKKLQEEKTVNNRTYKEVIEESAVNIAGYNAITPTTQSIEIGVGVNEIIFYYSRRTDIEYRVEYYYDGIKDESKTEVYTGTYEAEITEYEPKITEKYELEKVENLPLTIGANEEENVIKVWYVRKEARVVVHHYIEGTTNKISADVVINGQVDDVYNTTEAQNIPKNYECVGKTNNTSGNMTLEEIEVIYYYQLKEAGIKNEIQITGTEKLTKEEGEVKYTINSNVEVNTYIGDARITIVATLPYEIDEAKSELNGGVYNNINHTITWTETIQNIDTYAEGTKEINKEKTITVVYRNMDYSKTSFEAKAKTTVELETPKQEDTTEPSIAITQTEFIKEVEVTKVWNHTNNIYGIPQEVKIQVKNGEEIIAEKVLNSSNKVNNDENTWEWTFTDLPKYNKQGEEIRYTVEEVKEGNLNYYEGKIEYTQETQDVQKVKITNSYKGAVIYSEKIATTENGLSYVVEGEKITYTIKLQNNGELGQDVVVKDSIPEGTSFVNGSIKINNVADTSKTASNLNAGIRINVPARTNEVTPGEGSISFEVTVDEIGEVARRSISNIAIIDKNPDNPESGEEETNTTEIPVFIYSKKAEIIRGEGNEEIAEESVTAGDRIKYTITINNVGAEKIERVAIKDTVPEGTTIYQINNNGEISLNAGNVITWNVAEIAGGEEKEVSFEVTVDYDNVEKIIKNVATVDGKETNTTETNYEVPKIELSSNIEKTGADKITSTEEKVSYTINYTASIQDFVGKGKVKIVDYLPYEIDEANSELEGGSYNATEKTITWEIELGKINTYQNAERIQQIDINKTLLLKYNYPNENTLSGTISNNAEAEIVLTQEIEKENPENPNEPVKEEIEVKEETKADTHEVKVEIPAKVVVHHYIYDEEAGGKTKIKVPSKAGGVIADETIEGIVGQSYDTNPSEKINENYECVNKMPEKSEGNMTKESIEVIYYYQLKEAQIGSGLEKTATTEKITEENEVVTYKIRYRVVINNYKGKASITIIDKLPAELKQVDSRINLAGGTYNSAEKTITWKDEIEINTFEKGIYDETIEKEIKVVYQNQNVIEPLLNEATGSIQVYYPEGHSTNPGGERLNNIAADSVEVEQEYKVAKQVEKVWDDNEDTKGNRPESVTVQLTANGNTNYNGQELEKVILNEENHWTYTYADLPKYTQEGKEIEYSVVETETNKGDLEYYDVPVITNTKLNDITDGITPNEKFTVTNKYKLMNTEMQSSIEKTGLDKITSSQEEVRYHITYNATITDYIGEVVVKVVDTLPYKLATNEAGELLEQINLAEGNYDEETQTITWTETIEHVNTYTNGAYKVNIEKEINLVYSDLDATQRNMANQVTGTVDLYETEQTNSVEDSYSTKTEIPGKVIVKYIDKETGKEITYLEEQEGQAPVEKTYRYEIEGLVGDAYTTEQKEIPGYTYVKKSENATGNMIEGSIEVIYYYERTTAGGVIVHYEDEEGNKLLEDEIIGGKVGDNYETEQKEIYGYEYVKVEGTTQGKLTEEAIEVTYIYKRIPAKVIVKYLEKDNTQEDDSDNKELYSEEILEGFVGDNYTTNRKTITNYRAAEPEPSNKEGKMTKEDTYVIYYYEKIPSGTITAKYVDIDTKEEILYKEEEIGEYKTYREQMKGYVGENYQTEAKEIPYYNLVENQIPENEEGTYTQEDIEIIYYYRKQEFNMSIDKAIKQIEKDGKQEAGIDEKIDKIEIVGSKINTTRLKITYGIKVSNTGEIEGTAIVAENLPSNFQVEEGTASEWKRNAEGNLVAKVALKPGETKELTVVLSWIPGENHFGTKKNIAEIVKTSNPANYEDASKEGDTSEAEVVMTIKTGETTKNIILLVAIGLLVVGALGIFLKWHKNAT